MISRTSSSSLGLRLWIFPYGGILWLSSLLPVGGGYDKHVDVRQPERWAGTLAQNTHATREPLCYRILF